jgi:hypothetical protein
MAINRRYVQTVRGVPSIGLVPVRAAYMRVPPFPRSVTYSRQHGAWGERKPQAESHCLTLSNWYDDIMTA